MKCILRNCPNFDNYFWEQPTCNIYPTDCQNIEDCEVKEAINELLRLCKDRKELTQSLKQLIGFEEDNE